MTSPATSRGWELVDFDQLPAIACPCGVARRGLAEADDVPLTFHRTEIHETARTHYHKSHTEIYYILECGEQGYLELDGEQQSVRPGMCILIRPGVRHRAVGKMTVLIVCLPKFDPADEWFDD